MVVRFTLEEKPMFRRRTVLGLLAAAAASSPAGAASLAAPTGKVILTLAGKISIHNAGDTAQFDLAMLDALPQGRFEGETPWTKGNNVFTGPLGSAVLDAVGASGTNLRVNALNDYNADVPAADFRQHAVILATRNNGDVMSIRDKGPIWVIYPMDKEPALRVETTYTRSVWQVKSIDVL
jgi:hypothetical protein